MSHLDADVIASLAMGEDHDQAHRRHVKECPKCASLLSEIEATLASVTDLRGSGLLSSPPPRVWEAIRSDISADVTPQTDQTDAGSDQVAARRAFSHRAQTSWRIVAAAAAGVVVGGVGVGTVMWGGPQQTPPVVAQAELSDLQTETVVGVAAVHAMPDGSSLLVLDVPVAVVEGAALEVWLISAAFDGMISVGHLTPDTTSFVIPAGFDVSQFPIVDVSVEPFDGDPTHSGDSITRGELQL